MVLLFESSLPFVLDKSNNPQTTPEIENKEKEVTKNIK